MADYVCPVSSLQMPCLTHAPWIAAVQSGTLPQYITLISQLEAVQRFAARLVTKHWSTPTIHPLNHSTLYTNQDKNRR